jgi:hypothetical protein
MCYYLFDPNPQPGFNGRLIHLIPILFLPLFRFFPYVDMPRGMSMGVDSRLPNMPWYSVPPVKRYLYKRNYPLSDYPSVRRNLICWRQQIR